LQVLQTIKVKEIMRKDPIVIREDLKFTDILNFIPTVKHNNFPVVKQDHTLVGVLQFDEIREFIFEEGLEDLVVAGEICDKDVTPVLENYTLADAIEIIGFKNIEMLPVVNNLEEKKLIGILTRRDIVYIYNREMLKQKDIKVATDF
jgi:CIC family chloride channel protein